jgi:hypothetical protein
VRRVLAVALVAVLSFTAGAASASVLVCDEEDSPYCVVLDYHRDGPGDRLGVYFNGKGD